MLSDAELLRLLRDGEADYVERTATSNKSEKFGEAICAFANDLPRRGRAGVLFVGVHDDGRCAGLTIDERLMQTLLGFRTDGTIAPFPRLHARKVVLDGCELAVVEVEPSDNPPVRYQGRTCIRTGPRRGFATPEEERQLLEKRRWGVLPFDQQPVPGSKLADLDLLRFREEYLPTAVHPDVLAENHRDLEQQLLALRLLHPKGCATLTGLLVCGKDARAYVPGFYVQMVRYPGREIAGSVIDHKQIDGPLSEQLRSLDLAIRLNVGVSADLSGTQQADHPSYPVIALQELIRNAVLHRNYEATAAPVRLDWFEDRVEITSPGGPYGIVTIENFGRPGPTDYRNPALTDAAKNLGFVQKFGSGIARARAALAKNGNPEPEFHAEPTYTHVVVRARK